MNGTYLGPTLRASRGDVVEISVHNGVDEATTMHWHGMNLPARMDGGPYQPIEPGATWRPTWAIDQPAATLWYHPHPHGNTAAHVHRGVAGMFIVDDDEAGALDLPDSYGVDDLPVIIQDRSFDTNNQFVGDGRELGDELVVNGTYRPYVEVTHQRVRLRLLNASAGQFQQLGFDDGRSFQVIGTDGGLLPAPVTLERLSLSPGERAEIVVTFAPGEDAVLRNLAGDGATPTRAMATTTRPTSLQFHAAARARPVTTGAQPASPTSTASTPPTPSPPRTFRLTGTQINGQDMAPDRIDATVAAGTVEIWEITAEAGEHNFHIHGVQFQILDIDGSPTTRPPAGLEGHRRHPRRLDHPTPRTIRHPHRSRHPVHVPLPQTAPRRPRDDGPIRRRRRRRQAPAHRQATTMTTDASRQPVGVWRPQPAPPNTSCLQDQASARGAQPRTTALQRLGYIGVPAGAPCAAAA